MNNPNIKFLDTPKFIVQIIHGDCLHYDRSATYWCQKRSNVKKREKLPKNEKLPENEKMLKKGKREKNA